MKKRFIYIIAGLLMLFIGYALTANHWWKKVGSASVIYDEQPSSQAKVYRHPDGDLLINLESHGEGLYIVSYSKESGKWFVGQPNSPQFHFLPLLALAENYPEPFVAMGGVKNEVKPELTVQKNSVEFISSRKVRVMAHW